MKHLCVVALILGALVSLTLSHCTYIFSVQTNVRFLQSNNNTSFADTNGPEKCCFEFFESRISAKRVTHFEETDHRCPIRVLSFYKSISLHIQFLCSWSTGTL
uniref:Chemokine interleukin-8-like domain-containing protein n=1 Tax=Scleropages formosus TaxID=113540 RepID=A0A8C9V4S9_SCLFO